MECKLYIKNKTVLLHTVCLVTNFPVQWHFCKIQLKHCHLGLEAIFVFSNAFTEVVSSIESLRKWTLSLTQSHKIDLQGQVWTYLYTYNDIEKFLFFFLFIYPSV